MTTLTRDLAPKAKVLCCCQPSPYIATLQRAGGGWHVSGGVGTSVGVACRGVALSMGGSISVGVAYPWRGFTAGPYLVDGWQGGGIHEGVKQRSHCS